MASNKSNFITNMIGKFGENWIVALKPEDIQRSGKKIFKEMVRGNYDYQKIGNYFLDGKFLDNLIIAASNELEINTLYLNAVSFYRDNFPQIPNISVHVNHLQTICYIYNTILNKLQSVKQTGNIGWLADTSALLYSYRNHLI